MKIASTIALLLTSVALSPACWAGEPDTDHPLLGSWRVVAMEARGRPVSDVSFKGMRYTFDRMTWATKPGDTTPGGLAGRDSLQATYTIDDSADPKRLTGSFIRKGKDRTLKAIYKIEDDKLILSLGRDDWPTGFDTSQGKALQYTATRVETAAPDTSNGG